MHTWVTLGSPNHYRTLIIFNRLFEAYILLAGSMNDDPVLSSTLYMCLADGLPTSYASPWIFSSYNWLRTLDFMRVVSYPTLCERFHTIAWDAGKGDDGRQCFQRERDAFLALKHHDERCRLVYCPSVAPMFYPWPKGRRMTGPRRRRRQDWRYKAHEK
jgi:hypothetical protein